MIFQDNLRILPVDRFCEETSPTYFQSIQNDMGIISSYGKDLYMEI